MTAHWQRSYPAGVPFELEPSEEGSLVDFFFLRTGRFASRPAFIGLGRPLSYSELAVEAQAFAAWLQSLGLQPGARVALMLPNCLQYPVTLFGTLAAGMVVVNCNPLLTARELRLQLADSGAELVVVLENFAHTVQAARTGLPALRHVVVTGLGDLLGLGRAQWVNFAVRQLKKAVPPWQIPDHLRLLAGLAAGRSLVWRPPALTRQTLAFLQYTGGTTGQPKAAMLTHGNMLANLAQTQAWIRPFVAERSELIVTALPLYHIFSLTANCLTFFGIGAANLLIVNPRDLPAFVKTLRGHRFTAITGVNTLFNALLETAGFSRLDFSALHIALGGGMAVQSAVAERWQAVTGTPLIQAYGLTEASPAVCINPLDLPAFSPSVGLPLPSTCVDIRDEHGRSLPPGTCGELCIKGPQVMQGYWQAPLETARAFTPDGFLRTGDVARMDENGFVFLVDRRNDTILVSGFNVYPNEVEEVIALHPEVSEVAAVGVPDAHSGQVVKVFVVPRSAALTREALLHHCRENLAAYKVPRQIVFRDSLPKTPVGKILRRALRET